MLREMVYCIQGVRKCTRACRHCSRGNVVTNGGRVLAVTAFGGHFSEALKTSYGNMAKIEFDGMYYRKDLGFDL